MDPETLRRALDRSACPGLDRIRTLVAPSPLAVLVADDRARYVGANEAACALTGYTESELVGMSLPDLTARVDAPVAERLWTAFIDHKRQRGDFALRLKDGSAMIVRYEAVADVVPGLHVSFLRPLARINGSPGGGGEPASLEDAGERGAGAGAGSGAESLS